MGAKRQSVGGASLRARSVRSDHRENDVEAHFSSFPADDRPQWAIASTAQAPDSERENMACCGLSDISGGALPTLVRPRARPVVLAPVTAIF